MQPCKYQKIKNKKDNGKRLCLLNWYGGKPWLGNCLDCIKRGENTPEAKAAFDASSERSHPSNRKRIQGCCDRADQA
jgi:hypothetical protein